MNFLNFRRAARALLRASLIIAGFSLAVIANAADKSKPVRESNIESPVRGIERDHNKSARSHRRDATYRTIDGSQNNKANPDFNAAETQLRRMMIADYADYAGQMSGQDRAGPREVSNAVANQTHSRPNTLGLSDYVWQWGQFLDHDIDLTDGASPAELVNIAIPTGDPHFDPHHSGVVVLPFNRSVYDIETGTGEENPREQLNQITGWIDASNVYGSDEERAAELRTLDGSGRLKTSEGRLLPFNTAGLPNAGGSGPELFLAGDVRANEQIGLTAMHTLFVREHNRLARRIARNARGRLSGDEIYERARKIVGAQMQHITYHEFLPAILGRNALPRDTGYDESIDPSVMNEFSTGAYRFGHSLLNPTILRVNRRGNEAKAGHIALRDAFFSPSELVDHGIASTLRGLAKQACQNLDPFVIDDVRNFLFGAPGHGGFDLASLNIQRGRDHGLPSYNDAREYVGLSRAVTFADISSDIEIQNRLASVYPTPDYVDFWVGGLSEDHVDGALLGPLFHTVLVKQFEKLRDGDRYWYERSLGRAELRRVKNTRLSDIIRRNTRIGRELPNNVFRLSARD